MIMVNRVIVAGNLTRDPELRHTNAGVPVCAFVLAINRKSKTPEGEPKNDVSFIEVKAWDKVASDVCRYVKKGRLVLVEGRIRQERWESKSNGEPRSKIVIHAQYIQFLDGVARDAEIPAAEEPVEEYKGESDDAF